MPTKVNPPKESPKLNNVKDIFTLTNGTFFTKVQLYSKDKTAMKTLGNGDE